MSFIVAGFAFLLALLVGIVLDDVGIRRRQTTQRDLPLATSARRLFLNGSNLGLSHGPPDGPRGGNGRRGLATRARSGTIRGDIPREWHKEIQQLR
jgi:hypothetical protein